MLKIEFNLSRFYCKFIYKKKICLTRARKKEKKIKENRVTNERKRKKEYATERPHVSQETREQVRALKQNVCEIKKEFTIAFI